MTGIKSQFGRGDVRLVRRFLGPVNAGWSSVKVMCSLRPRYANAMYFVLRCCVLAGQLAVGTCEIVMLNRDSSIPRRTIARQTARCACRRGQIAGTTRARPACVDGKSLGQISRFAKKTAKKQTSVFKGRGKNNLMSTVRPLISKSLIPFPRTGPSLPRPPHPVIYRDLKGKVLAEGQK